MKVNFKIYKEIVREYISNLESRDNLVRYNQRLVYAKCVPCTVGEKDDRPAYAYFCKDLAMKHELEKHLIERAEDQNMSDSDVFDAMQGQGIFMLIASCKISIEKLLPLYYTRDQVEKSFGLCKQDGKNLLFSVET